MKAQKSTDSLHFDYLVSYSAEIVNYQIESETKCYADRNLKTLINKDINNKNMIVWNEKLGKTQSELLFDNYSYSITILPDNFLKFNPENVENSFYPNWLLYDSGEKKVSKLNTEKTIKELSCKYYQIEFVNEKNKSNDTSFKICVNENNPINNAKIFSDSKTKINGLILEIESNKSMERLTYIEAKPIKSNYYIDNLKLTLNKYKQKIDSINKEYEKYYEEEYYEEDYADSIAQDYPIEMAKPTYINESYIYENQPNYCKSSYNSSKIFKNQIAENIYNQYFDNICETYKTINGFINKDAFKLYIDEDIKKFKILLSSIKEITPKEADEIIAQIQNKINMEVLKF